LFQRNDRFVQFVTDLTLKISEQYFHCFCRA